MAANKLRKKTRAFFSAISQLISRYKEYRVKASPSETTARTGFLLFWVVSLIGFLIVFLLFIPLFGEYGTIRMIPLIIIGAPAMIFIAVFEYDRVLNEEFYNRKTNYLLEEIQVNEHAVNKLSEAQAKVVDLRSRIELLKSRLDKVTDSYILDLEDKAADYDTMEQKLIESQKLIKLLQARIANLNAEILGDTPPSGRSLTLGDVKKLTEDDPGHKELSFRDIKNLLEEE